MIALPQHSTLTLRFKLYVLINLGQNFGNPPHRSRSGLVAEKGNCKELSQSVRVISYMELESERSYRIVVSKASKPVQQRSVHSSANALLVLYLYYTPHA